MASHNNLGDYLTVTKELRRYNGNLEMYKNSIASESHQRGVAQGAVGMLIIVMPALIGFACLIIDKCETSVAVKLDQPKEEAEEKLLPEKEVTLPVDETEQDE